MASASTTDLVELDSLEILVIIDNELDPISQSPNPAVQQSGGIKDITMRAPPLPSGARGGSAAELRMDHICCSAHGLSLMITGIKDGHRRTMLFDTGPEESAWERNATRLKASISDIEVIQLSHWHRDHSGGMLKVLDMINNARSSNGQPHQFVLVDLHPKRPDYRGVQPPNAPVLSFEADPTFSEIEHSKGTVCKSSEPHTVLDNTFLISGEIPKVTPYEKGLRFGVRFDASSGEWEPDEAMIDERMLMCKLKDKGIVMFTGCSHTGVVNASNYAVELGNGSPLYAVMGGFHLADAQPSLIQDTVNDLRALDAKLLLAGHCTGWRAKFEIQKEMPGRLVPSFVGSKFVL